MPLRPRTIRDKIYIDLLTQHGPQANSVLAKEAMKNLAFRGESYVTIEKDVDRFAERYEELGLLTRKEGKIHWIATSGQQRIVPLPGRGQQVLSSDGFLTSKAGVKCDHCGHTIDLTQTKMRWRPKSRFLALTFHVHHIFRVTCPNCGWVGRYDTRRDVKPILP